MLAPQLGSSSFWSNFQLALHPAIASSLVGGRRPKQSVPTRTLSLPAIVAISMSQTYPCLTPIRRSFGTLEQLCIRFLICD